jgi:hypothetical protein
MNYDRRRIRLKERTDEVGIRGEVFIGISFWGKRNRVCLR